jgi:hypothetical protein
MNDLRYKRQSPVCLILLASKYCFTSALSVSEKELFLLLKTTFFKRIDFDECLSANLLNKYTPNQQAKPIKGLFSRKCLSNEFGFNKHP